MAGEPHAETEVAEAAAFGEMLLNCTSGVASLDALKAAGEGHLNGKVLLDIANPLDFSKGQAVPPSLSVSNTDSLTGSYAVEKTRR